MSQFQPLPKGTVGPVSGFWSIKGVLVAVFVLITIEYVSLREWVKPESPEFAKDYFLTIATIEGHDSQPVQGGFAYFFQFQYDDAKGETHHEEVRVQEDEYHTTGNDSQILIAYLISNSASCDVVRGPFHGLVNPEYTSIIVGSLLTVLFAGIAGYGEYRIYLIRSDKEEVNGAGDLFAGCLSRIRVEL